MGLTNYVLMPGADYQALCDAIRAKTGKTEALKSGELATEVESITGGGSVQTTEYLPETTFTNLFVEALGAHVHFESVDAETLETWAANQKPVTVIYDNVEYILTPQLLTHTNGDTGIGVGNAANFGGTGNGEPFLIVQWYLSGEPCFLVASLVDTTPTEHTVRVYQEVSGGGSMEGIHTVTFMTEDGSAVLYERYVADGDDCANVVDRGLLDTPTKESTAQYNYSHSGWSLTSGGLANASALSAVTADRTVYAAFTSAVRYYTVTYYDSDGTTVLKTESLPYGSMPSYTPEKDGYMFTGWTTELTIVTGDASYICNEWEKPMTLADYTWEQIDAMTLAEAQEKFSVGDIKDKFILVAFNQDTLASGGKAKMSFLTTGLKTSQALRAEQTGVYTNLNVYTNMIADPSKYIPNYSSDIESVAKSVKKSYVSNVSNATIGTVSQKFWLASASELGYKVDNETVLAEGDKYAIFSEKETSGKIENLTGDTIWFWHTADFVLRSRNTQCWIWLDNGTPKMSYGYFSGSHYPLVGFCI